MNKQDIDLGIEYSFLRLPYNLGVKVFKDDKRIIEKEMNSIMVEILNQSKNKNTLENKTELKKQINLKIEQLKDLKTKLKFLHSQEEKIFRAIQQRIQEFQDLQNLQGKFKLGDKRPHADLYWQRLLNRNLVEYLVRVGAGKSSEELEKVLDKTHSFEFEQKIIENNQQIYEQLCQGKVDDALAWCKENRSKLSRMGSRFEFKLVLKKYLQKLKEGSTMDAIEIQRSNLVSGVVEDESVESLRKSCRLLITGTNNEVCNGVDKVDDTIELAKEFRSQCWEVEALNKVSTFESYIQSGIAALKTIFCYNKSCKPQSICPCCNIWINETGSKVPFTPTINSFLRCRISGKEMNEDNPPIVLPNNQVYSHQAVKNCADRNNGIILCPITGQKYNLNDIAKIFLTS